MANLGNITVNVDLQPSERVKQLIADEVQRQLEAHVDPKKLAKAAIVEMTKAARLGFGKR